MEIYQNDLSHLDGLSIHATSAEIVSWLGRQSLKLDGLVVIPDLEVTSGHIEVEIAALGPAYPGIAFRLADRINYELAYTQPHTSGKWDALQYDPIFHGSNTWQMYYGPGYQQAVQVFGDRWFRFSVDFDDDWAIVSLEDQPPLVVKPLAHTHRTGWIGLWNYLPACFSNLRIHDQPVLTPAKVEIPTRPAPPPGTIMEWYMEGYGRIACEETGILNLNRCLPRSCREASLSRQFELAESSELEVALGCSDQLTLLLDGQILLACENLFHSSPEWYERGYVALNQPISFIAAPGKHRLEAVIKDTEGFGFGMTLALSGADFRLLPVELG